ncbi:hypothetical protein [Natrarchaeobius oligotrophus]|uniref:Uncharacterized protein n=1 Tax=Natrarchaeobius chitinivorans TaxID=1679083 RepID=A0A3N6M6K1_NATCH|nr:hypothetical protein [Natrarchaeobius chitinivorans]RQG96224.1 hypothetical protein EA472_20775 [Natrarchaeobius chitinivorans]
MTPGPRGVDDELLVCVDVLGAFGVTAAEIRREIGDDGPLEEVLAGALADGRDRTTVLRRIVARSDRGLSCSARYASESLGSELTSIFEAVGWTVECAWSVDRRRLTVSVVDHTDRRRERTVSYPETPLGTDNLPAILRSLDDALLSGTDARFVLLSSGVDRWRAALVDGGELEGLRDRYGPRVRAVGRPLLPEYGLDAFVPEGNAEETRTADPEDGPWPAWASERERDDRPTTGGTQVTLQDAAALIEEAEDDRSDRDGGDGRADGRRPPPTDATRSATDGEELEFRGGSPAVVRMHGEHAERSSDEDDESERARDDPSTGGDDGSAGGRADGRGGDDASGPETAESKSLSGAVETARVANDAFGSDVAWEREDDRYRALGAALGAGGDVAVRGVLEDDDFLPELPPAEPVETRIEFDDEFDPGAVPRAKAVGEQSGYRLVGSGSLETTRLSNR